jgi:hypothetical protein
VGHVSDPLEFVPHPYCDWQNRFDDPERQYRTLYSARLATTCFREVLQAFRPNAKAIAEYIHLFGDTDGLRAGEVPWKYRESKVLVPVSIVPDTAFLDVDDLETRRELEGNLAELLAEHGIDHLDISEIRSRQRPVTQAISRLAYEGGCVGVAFRSNLDDADCWAIFEGRAVLAAAGTSRRLSESIPELEAVCAEWNLTLLGVDS